MYFGSGEAAGRLAGVTKHAGKFIVLLPRVQQPAQAPSPQEAAKLEKAGQ
ncbi:MAG TPA: hypothetical protein VFA64_05410 [Hyphomicrobiaceae bacterium]|nr:hypothetical protein [Hyphomicrobiaceae bacterium]